MNRVLRRNVNQRPVLHNRGLLNSWGDLVTLLLALLFVVAAGVGLVLATAPRAHAQTVYPTPAGNNVRVPGMVQLHCDGNGANCAPASRANLATGQVAVSTSATLVVAARATRQSVVLSPTTSVVYYVGGVGVTSATGIYVAAGASISLATAAAVYAVGASAVTISYAELF